MSGSSWSCTAAPADVKPSRSGHGEHPCRLTCGRHVCRRAAAAGAAPASLLAAPARCAAALAAAAAPASPALELAATLTPVSQALELAAIYASQLRCTLFRAWSPVYALREAVLWSSLSKGPQVRTASIRCRATNACSMAAALHLMRPLCCEAQRTGCVAGRGPPVHSSTHATLRQASASLGCGHLKNCRPGLAADRLVRMTHSRPWRGHRGAPPPAAAWPPALPRLRPQARAGVHVAGLRACGRSGSSSSQVDSRCTPRAALQTVGNRHGYGHHARQ